MIKLNLKLFEIIPTNNGYGFAIWENILRNE